MPELDFQVTGVEPIARGLAPLLHFRLRVASVPDTESIQALILQAQIQIEPAQRAYTTTEKEKLVELFGTPERWGQTLRNRLWTHANTTVGAFTGSSEAVLPVPCTFDLNIAATKYFYALEGSDIPLRFLFSGSVFYMAPGGRLQVQRISWDKECAFRMPARVWREMMESHYPNSAWLYLQRDVFERLCGYKRRHGMATWEEAVERLLAEETGDGRQEPGVVGRAVPSPPLRRGEDTAPCRSQETEDRKQGAEVPA